ncbi:hypothetical protein ES705_39451 [subsurface metagenome]
MNQNLFSINPLENDNDPSKSPFNTSAIDLRLGNEVLIPKSDLPIQIDLTKSGIAKLLNQICDRVKISKSTPYS